MTKLCIKSSFEQLEATDARKQAEKPHKCTLCGQRFAMDDQSACAWFASSEREEMASNDQ